MNARIRLDEDLRRFRLAMDATADAIFLVDRAGMCFVDVNATACRMLGFEREDFCARAEPLARRRTAQAGRPVRQAAGRRPGRRHDRTAAAVPEWGALAVEVQRRTLRSGSSWIWWRWRATSPSARKPSSACSSWPTSTR
jgi:PAS domain-containing protein